jgi:conjugative transfer signal peptidase TraF
MNGGRFALPVLPVPRTGEEVWRGRRAQRTLRNRMAGGALFVSSILASAALKTEPRLVWNASASAPLGLYVVALGQTPKSGDWVVARLAPPIARLAAERGYLPAGVPVVKRIAGVPGDRICADGAYVSRNRQRLAMRLPVDVHGRTLPTWQGCIRLGARRYFLLNADAPGSFDGRYFGPTNVADILGVATPLWLR